MATAPANRRKQCKPGVVWSRLSGKRFFGQIGIVCVKVFVANWFRIYYSKGSLIIMKQKFLTLLILTLAFGAFSAAVFAQETKPAEGADNAEVKKERGYKRGGFFGEKGGPGGRHGRKGGRGLHGMNMMRGFHKLDLTDAQKEQARGIMEGLKASTQTQRDEIHALRKQKHEGTITADGESRLKALGQELKEKGKQAREQMLGILTSEQKQRLEQMKEEMKQRKQERRQNRPPRQAPPQGETKPGDSK
jgi:Spy/CpxP family protein refolding chaperone